MGYVAEIAKEVNGTYAAMWPTKESHQKLRDYFKPHIPDLVDDFHVTTTYSRVILPRLRDKTFKVQTNPKFYKYDAFGDRKQYLVLVVKHPAFDALWKAAMQMGATWDYKEYTPHISLSTDFQGKLSDLPPLPGFPLNFDKFKVEELRED